jgi:catechol 2,3-dioxygenase-like lactoylglutathione lyase family enzyme
MEALGLVWVGTRTTQYAATFAFFRDVLGLDVNTSEIDFGVLELADGATVEVFGPTSPYNAHLTHPVAGFLVSDLNEAVTELQAAGAEIVLALQHGGPRKWMHFRAPDGFVYELVEDTSR